MKKKNVLTLLLFVFVHLSTAAAIADGSGDAIRLQTFKDHSRILFNLDDTVTPKWKSSKTGFELFIKGIGLADLGAPLGEEAQWKAQYGKIADGRLAKIDFVEVPGGLKILGVWKYPSGANALANPVMDSFDYREKNPPQYVVDFWVKKGPSIAEVKAARIEEQRLAVKRDNEERSRERTERRNAVEKQKLDAEDTNRFCREPLKEEKDVFLPLFPVHAQFDFSKVFATTTPDSRFSYFTPTKDDAKDAQYVRLALRLYKQGNPALVIRTLDFLDNEYPKSLYLHEMRFLRANALIKLGLSDEADRVLLRLIADAKNSPVVMYSGTYMANKLLLKKNYLASFAQFMGLITNFPEQRLSWVFHLGAAECLFALQETDRAVKEYEWIIENAPDRMAQAQAAIRLGDLYLSRFQSDQALAAYSQGQKYFKEESEEFPTLAINKAEAFYGLGEYGRARDAFTEFLHSYPSNSSGWRATFRLGEIAGREGTEGSEFNDHAARKWFYETINRFPFSAGATLARLRLVTCGDHGGFSMASSERFFATEAKNYDGQGEVFTSRYKEFMNLAHVRALIDFGYEDRAIDAAIEALPQTKNEKVAEILRSTLTTLFRKTIDRMLNEGKKYEALAFYHDRATLILHDRSAADPDFLLRLSLAAGDLGLGTLAKEIADSYNKLMTQTNRAVATNQIASDDIDAQLKLSEQNYTEAKALWIESGFARETDIRRHLALVNEESPYSFGSEIILGKLDEKKDNIVSALNHVAHAQLLSPGSPNGADFRMDYWLATLQARAGDPKMALKMLRGIENRITLNAKNGATQKVADHAAEIARVLGVQAVPSVDQIVIDEGEIFENLKSWGEAASTYARAMGSSRLSNQATFNYARALIKSGDRKSKSTGLAVLEQLSDSKTDDFWKKLAKETLADEKSRQLVK